MCDNDIGYGSQGNIIDLNGMKIQLQHLFQEIIQDLGIKDVVVNVVMTENSVNGDYTTNIAMKLAKQLKKSPMDIALQVKEAISHQLSAFSHQTQDLNTIKDNQKISTKVAYRDVLQAIDHIDVVSPGFINIFLTESVLSASVAEVLKLKESYGTSRLDAKTIQGKRVTVEFTDPNPFKEFHIGHLYSNSVGESVSRLLESQGHTVRRVNYQGDVGMHVAKAMYGLLQITNPNDQILKLEREPLPEKAKFLGAAYAVGSAAFEESDEVKKEIGLLNKKIYDKDPAIYPFYTKTRQWSLDYFEGIYQRLGTKFQGYYFESVVGQRGAKLVRDHVSDGVFEESDGAIIYRGEKKRLHTRVFMNKLGLPTYEAKELGLALTKQDDWPYDLSIIVTGNEINEYFKVLLAALADVAPELAEKTLHMGHGMVRKSDGSKMSSRSGVVLSGEGLLDEVKVSIYELIDKNKSNYSKPSSAKASVGKEDQVVSETSRYSPQEKEEIAEKSAVAAVKYSLLRVSLPSDVAFDVNTSVSFDGDSGPYLLYTYARCKSVLQKSQTQMSPINLMSHISLINLNPEERLIARLIHFYPQIVADSAAAFAPSMLCKYLFDLASSFNAFYAKHTILGEGENAGHRTALTAATAQVLRNGLYLLGIETVERM